MVCCSWESGVEGEAVVRRGRGRGDARKMGLQGGRDTVKKNKSRDAELKGYFYILMGSC